MQNFVQFRAIKSNVKITTRIGKKEYQRPLLSYMYPISIIVISNNTYILYINFCEISSTRNRDQRIPKILEKLKVQRQPLNGHHQKLIEINLC